MSAFLRTFLKWYFIFSFVGIMIVAFLMNR